MTQFRIQFYKDFRSYFTGFNAYIILGCYCFLSFILAIYLGNYFLRETDVINSYLSLQPFVLMLLIPALTMRSWTDEIKSGTLELLLTQPISYFTLVMAKFCAAFAFFNLMLLCSLPLLITTMLLSLTDSHAILLGYTGLWLCGMFFTALGCMISSCHRNNIVCYLTTILAIFIVIELKFTSIAVFHNVFPLTYLNFSFHYNSFLNGFFYLVNIQYFLLASLLCLWTNVILITYQRDGFSAYKAKFILFCLLLFSIFTSANLGLGYSATHAIDVTRTKKYTLSEQSFSFLEKNEQRIDIVLYESAKAREDIHSGYSLYADYIEHFLNLVEKASLGSIRTEIVYVEPFSNQERNLVRRKIPYTEDSYGHKIFMVADFSDNEGHFATINSFSPLRQNLLEADVMRVIRRFTLPKQNIAVFASSKDWDEMNGLKNILNEFYKLTYWQSPVSFIPPFYSAVLVINPLELSGEFLLAMDQYILNGGKLLLFYDPLSSTTDNTRILQKFATNYGIKIQPDDLIIYTEKDEDYTFGPSYPTDTSLSADIRSVIVNNAGHIDMLPSLSDSYLVSPLLTFNNQLVGAKSSGRFVSEYLHLAATEETIEAISQKDGTFIFFHDTDFLKDYLYLTEDSSHLSFYENIPTADNLLFILRLLDFSLAENVEKNIPYKHSVSDISSIGQAILKSVKSRYTEKIQQLEKKIKGFEHAQKYEQSDFFVHGLPSAKNLNDSYNTELSMEEAQDQLGHIYTEIFNEYETFIITLSVLLIFIIPFISLLFLALFLHILKKRKFHRIRRLIDNE